MLKGRGKGHPAWRLIHECVWGLPMPIKTQQIQRLAQGSNQIVAKVVWRAHFLVALLSRPAPCIRGRQEYLGVASSCAASVPCPLQSWRSPIATLSLQMHMNMPKGHRIERPGTHQRPKKTLRQVQVPCSIHMFLSVILWVRFGTAGPQFASRYAAGKLKMSLRCRVDIFGLVLLWKVSCFRHPREACAERGC